MNDEQLKNSLKEKPFWLARAGMKKHGIFTFNEKGELREVTEKEKLSVEQKVHAWSGEQPLTLHVCSDNETAYIGWRFSLGAHHMPQIIAPVVVGVPASNVPVPFHLIREAKQQVIKLRGTTKPEALDAIEKVLDSL